MPAGPAPSYDELSRLTLELVFVMKMAQGLELPAAPLPCSLRGLYGRSGSGAVAQMRMSSVAVPLT
jgi:hypothetical protein